jgi:small-conductance mechanosensitive channel
VLSILVSLEVAGYDSITILLSTSATLAALSFGLGSAISVFVGNLIFVTYKQPYNIGDVVR